MSHQVFDHLDFYEKLDCDLRLARFLVIIQSPFMTLRRVNSLRPILSDCAARGVRVCVFTQKINQNYLTDEEYFEKVATMKKVTDTLSSIDVHVNEVPKIHEKLVTIDESIFWEGSLNPLSYRDTSERMTRWQCREKVWSVMIKHDLRCSVCKEVSLLDDIQGVFGKIIQSRRKMLNLSQKKFAELAGLEQSTISRIERGEYDVRISTISKIFSVLRMSCRPIFWYMVPHFDYEINLSLKRAAKHVESDIEKYQR